VKQVLAEIFTRLQEEPGSPPAPVAWRALAGALAGVYGLGASGRRALYTRGWWCPRHLPCRVISVGNLAVGGSGKTPLTVRLARRWLEGGRRVAVLSRGYGGRSRGVQVVSDGTRVLVAPPQAADEAYLVARQVPGAVVVTGACRYGAGRVAWERYRPDLMLLDDGFQHYQLHRDLDLVLLDAERPFGNGRLLPRGPLREPVSVLRPPLTLVLTRYREDRHRPTWEALQQAFPGLPVLRASLEPARLRRRPQGEDLPLDDLRGRRLTVFAGLARPRVVAATLEELGAVVVRLLPFPDHHDYSPAEVEHLAALAASRETDGLITTEKDWVRLEGRWPKSAPLLVLGVEAQLVDPWPEDWE